MSFGGIDGNNLYNLQKNERFCVSLLFVRWNANDALKIDKHKYVIVVEFAYFPPFLYAVFRGSDNYVYSPRQFEIAKYT